MSNKVSSKVLLVVAILAAAWDTARSRELLAKPARVPFTQDDGDGEILVHLSSDLLQLCGDVHPLIHLTDEHGLVVGQTRYDEAAYSHTDRFGYNWMIINFDLSRFQLGVTRLQVTVCSTSTVTKVVKAQWKERRTYTVDNKRGYLLDASGFPFVLFGSYTYGIVTEVEREVPETEVPFGMNWIAPYLSEAKGHTNETWTIILSFLDRCEEIGVMVNYDLHQLASLPDTSEKWSLLETEIKTVMNHPAIATYYLADEPGGQGIDPSLLEKAYNFVKGIDPNRPITEVFCCVDPAKYIDSFDIGMADPYPIPTSTPFYITGKANELIATGKPFFMVIQSFGGGEIWERQPTPAEERAMTYIAMIKGAIGIQYFVRSPRQFPYDATSWSECRRLSLEFRELASAILSGGSILNVSSSVGERILATGWEERVKGSWVVAAVNVLNSPVNVSLTTNVSYSGLASVIFQDRTVNVVDGVIVDVLSAYGSAAYRFPPINSTQVNSKNLLSNPSFEQVTSASGPDGAYLNVPTDLASTYLTDSRYSVDGLHSLQLTTPTKGGGFEITPFNIKLTSGTEYELSFWAMSREQNLTLEFSFSDLSPTSAVFQTSTEWTKYSTNLESTATSDRVDAVIYELVSAGTVWVDLLQLIPST